MPSNSLSRWNRERAAALDEIENAHLRVGGTERGRRYATQQINFAYVTLLSSQFQGYCRDLHSESIDYVVAVLPTHLQGLLRREFLFSRNLERGNPHPGAIGSDFMRLGIDIWAEGLRVWRSKPKTSGTSGGHDQMAKCNRPPRFWPGCARWYTGDSFVSCACMETRDRGFG